MSSSTPPRPAHWANDAGTLFQNPWPSGKEVAWSELIDGKLPVSFHNRPVSEDITVVKPDWGKSALHGEPGKSVNDYMIATWLGHSGALVEIPSAASGSSRKAGALNSVYLVFDPIFSQRAGPSPWIGPARFRKTPCSVSELPGCDAVFISHNHFDHLDLPTVTSIIKSFPQTLWFVPLGNKKWMIDSGAKKDKVFEKDWWMEWQGDIKAQSLKITCVPAQHNSARAGLDKNQTLWCGWVIETIKDGKQKAAIYHAGDTGYRRLHNSPITCPVFKEIGKKFDGFDLSFIPIWRGGTLGVISFWGLKLNHAAIAAIHHAYPKDGLEIHKDVQSRNSIPVHFGTFVGSANESQESIEEFREACTSQKVTRFTEDDAGHGRADLLNIGASTIIEIKER